MSLGFTLAMIHIVLNVVGTLQQALVTQAITDPLSGAFNRRHLQTHLGERVAPPAADADAHALLLFRTGGEEFVLLLPRATPEAALRVAENLRQRLAQTELLAGYPVTVSIGLSTLAPGQTAEAWLKAADTALYEAKRQGRNRVLLAAA